MAVTVTKLLTDVADASTTTGWTADGNWGSLATDNAVFREGGSSLRGQVSQAAGHVWFTLGAAVDLTLAANRRVYAWILPPGSFDTLANGGLRIVLGDGTNRIAYYVGGNDVAAFQVGAWSCVTLDANNLPTGFAVLAGVEANLTLTAITEIGIGINNPAKATGNSPNAWFDIVRYGTGLRITGGGVGTEGTFAEIAADDASTAAGKAYGIIREVQAGVYGVQGDVVFGDGAGTGSVDFLDDSAVVVVEDNVKGAATNTPINISGEHNATGTFSVELGIAVGTGDDQRGRAGVTFFNANLAQAVNFDFSDTDIDDFAMYGCILNGMTGTVAFSADATNGPNHVLSGDNFERCGQVALGRVVTRNCAFAAYTGADAALLWNANVDIKRCQFLANADATNDPAGIEHDTTTGSPFTYDALTFNGNDFDVFNSSGGAITINAINGANPGTDRTPSGSTTINNAVSLDVTATVSGPGGTPVAVDGARVRIERQSDGSLVTQGTTNSSGVFTDTFNFGGTDVPVFTVIRLKGFNDIRPAGTITADGLIVDATLTPNPTVNLP